MQLKESVTAKYIMKKSKWITELAMDKLSKSKNVILLGNKQLRHLPTYSMLIRHSISGYTKVHLFISS